NFEPKITNFRFARPLHPDPFFDNHFDPIEHWIAPEQLRHKKRSAYYTYKCDIF
ncbi:166_t:CDS:1, partial [Entrophospora sp. SA101]